MDRIRTLLLNLGALAFLCAFAPGAHADEKFFVQERAVFDEKAEVPPAVFHECKLDEHLGREVFRRVSESIPGAAPLRSPAEPGELKYLKLTIVEVHGWGGGSWSGAKSVRLRADLQQSGRQIATHIFFRGSRGGAWGPMMGTCGIMDRIAETLGRDAAGWAKAYFGVPGASPAPKLDPPR